MYHLNIMNKTKLWFSISGVLVILSIVSLIIFGLNLGIDFTGGSMMNLEFKEIQKPNQETMKNLLSEFDIKNIKIQASGENGYIIRMSNINEETHQAVLSRINEEFITDEVQNKETENSGLQIEGENIEGIEINSVKTTSIIEEKRFDAIGPVIGQELKEKSVWAMLVVLLAIVSYIAYVFRKVSKPVESWKYGISAIIALAHDVIIITGVFSILGHFMGVDMDSFFITALLTILGFSVNDTIVTFDRVRENLHKRNDLTFKNLINLSINETITRSLNTSFTTFIVLFSVFLFGGASIKFFVLALMLGVVIGTYSSIFIASPLLMFWYRLKYKKA